jgi:hypothetical protein
MSCYVPLRSIEARPGSPSSTSTLAHSDEAHFGCLHHHPFTLPEAVPDHLTKFPDGVDVAALRKSLHHPFALPDLVPDHLTEFPARAEVAAPHKQHHDAFTIRGSGFSPRLFDRVSGPCGYRGVTQTTTATSSPFYSSRSNARPPDRVSGSRGRRSTT